METKQIFESISETVKQELTAFVEQEGNITPSKKYKAPVFEPVRLFSKVVIEGIQGKVPKSRNLKKIYPASFGKIDLNQKHVLCKSTDKFGISATVQELMCLLGQYEVYKEALDTFARMLKLYISAPQIVSTHYGESLSQLIKINKEEVIPRLQGVRKQDNIYVMLDRSMV